jgi:DDE superfamily endonuclease
MEEVFSIDVVCFLGVRCFFYIITIQLDASTMDNNQQLATTFEEDDDDDADDTLTLLAMYDWYTRLVIMTGILISSTGTPRNPPLFIQKLKWQDYINKFNNNVHFIKCHLRMTLKSFYKLLSYIKDGLLVDEHRASCRGGAILPKICLFCTLQWLAGGSYLDIFTLTGVSIASFYRIVCKTLRLIVNWNELQIKLPQNEAECKQSADGFQSISTKAAITNCIGVIDGYLLRIYTPTKADAGNVRSYFSGHYQCHGINVQAICDHHSRFTFVSVAAPGSVNDQDAIQENSLLATLDKLPKVFVIIGDAAYAPSNRIVPMFYGINKNDLQCDNFNLYASQCRIRIEMAFGLMQMKWGILWQPLRVKFNSIKWVVLAIVALHNFTINEQLAQGKQIEEVGTDDNRVYLESEISDESNENDEHNNIHSQGLSII